MKGYFTGARMRGIAPLKRDWCTIWLFKIEEAKAYVAVYMESDKVFHLSVFIGDGAS